MKYNSSGQDTKYNSPGQGTKCNSSGQDIECNYSVSVLSTLYIITLYNYWILTIICKAWKEFFIIQAEKNPHIISLVAGNYVPWGVCQIGNIEPRSMRYKEEDTMPKLMHGQTTSQLRILLFGLIIEEGALFGHDL